MMIGSNVGPPFDLPYPDGLYDVSFKILAHSRIQVESFAIVSTMTSAGASGCHKDKKSRLSLMHDGFEPQILQALVFPSAGYGEFILISVHEPDSKRSNTLGLLALACSTVDSSSPQIVNPFRPTCEGSLDEYDNIFIGDTPLRRLQDGIPYVVGGQHENCWAVCRALSVKIEIIVVLSLTPNMPLRWFGGSRKRGITRPRWHGVLHYQAGHPIVRIQVHESYLSISLHIMMVDL